MANTEKIEAKTEKIDSLLKTLTEQHKANGKKVSKAEAEKLFVAFETAQEQYDAAIQAAEAAKNERTVAVRALILGVGPGPFRRSKGPFKGQLMRAMSRGEGLYMRIEGQAEADEY